MLVGLWIAPFRSDFAPYTFRENGRVLFQHQIVMPSAFGTPGQRRNEPALFTVLLSTDYEVISIALLQAFPSLFPSLYHTSLCFSLQYLIYGHHNILLLQHFYCHATSSCDGSSTMHPISGSPFLAWVFSSDHCTRYSELEMDMNHQLSRSCWFIYQPNRCLELQSPASSGGCPLRSSTQRRQAFEAPNNTSADKQTGMNYSACYFNAEHKRCSQGLWRGTS